jgi:glycolate oxidase FAD binding subunit
MSSETITIDGQSLPVAHAASAADVGALVREGKPLYPVGGGTQLHVGLPPAKRGVAVALTGLDALIDHAARDMTVTVQAGMRISRLHDILAAEGQRLPVDIPFPSQATIGGSIAVNVSGPRRYGSGTLRDFVLGISTVGAEGHETKAGGRVVKNVAGYDLCKLHTGALGTLGVITQVTLKVRPVPEASLLVASRCDGARLTAALDALHESRTRPMALEALSGPAAKEMGLGDGEWWVVVGFEDNAQAVQWQAGKVREELAAVGLGVDRTFEGEQAEALWRRLTEGPASARAVWKATMLPGKTATFCLAVGPGVWLQAHAGNGVVKGALPVECGLEEARGLVGRIEGRAEACGGSVTLPRCPTEWKAFLPVWGKPREDWALMRAVKSKLDPAGVFNPGRFTDGI